MKISSDDQKGISVILICLGVLFGLIGIAGHLKSGFQSRAEISTTGLIAAAIFVGLGIVLFLVSLAKRQN